MNSAATVTNLMNQWKLLSIEKAAFVVKLAESCLGWSYVYGARGEICNKTTRNKYYNNYLTRNPGEAAQIKKTCQILNGKKDSCEGCSFYPNGSTRCFDCRGFTYWVFLQVGIKIEGGGATSQWNDDNNWSEKGDIKDLPAGKVACVFMRNGSTMGHTGIHIGGGNIIHCSGTVTRGKTTDKGWTHYAIPKGMEGVVPVPDPGTDRPTLRKGSKGEYVTLLQTKLIQLGYDLNPYGADGSYGNKTVEAVKLFQIDHNLTDDGICGKKTWAALDSGEITLFTVTIQHVSKTVAEGIIKTYGGNMTAE